MSFRATYITSFLYMGDDIRSLDKISSIFGEHGTSRIEGHDGLGYIHGVIKGGFPQELLINNELEDLCCELRKNTKHSFEFSILTEGGPILTYRIEP